MADLTSHTAATAAAAYPIDAVDSTLDQAQPLVGAQEIRDVFLFGIPLISAIVDPVTKKAAVFTDAMIKKVIQDTVSKVEAFTGVTILPTVFKERQPYDRTASEQGAGLMYLNHRPVRSIQKVAVVSTDQVDVYTIPPQWIERGFLARGRVHIVPFAVAYSAGTVSAVGLYGPGLLPTMGRQTWVPAFWNVEYLAGFADGNVPPIVNELIGTMAAIRILSILAATYANSNSSSLSIDGVSQSVSSPGPQRWAVRMEELEKERDVLAGRLKGMYGLAVKMGLG